jgi:hypothetical protein
MKCVISETACVIARRYTILLLLLLTEVAITRVMATTISGAPLGPLKKTAKNKWYPFFKRNLRFLDNCKEYGSRTCSESHAARAAPLI